MPQTDYFFTTLRKLARAVVTGMQYIEPYPDAKHIPRSHRGQDISGINTGVSSVYTPYSGPKPRVQKVNDVTRV